MLLIDRLQSVKYDTARRGLPAACRVLLSAYSLCSVKHSVYRFAGDLCPAPDLAPQKWASYNVRKKRKTTSKGAVRTAGAIDTLGRRRLTPSAREIDTRVAGI